MAKRVKVEPEEAQEGQEQKQEEKDDVVSEIESYLAKGEHGYLITIHPNGIAEIATGQVALLRAREGLSSSRALLSYSCNGCGCGC
ncbi:MAG: hypothetical protein O7E52_17705 [Candidatus Poribacteria bacterium]|nr:hypothetical protein [Candidatus Poribacteria bacterium]